MSRHTITTSGREEENDGLLSAEGSDTEVTAPRFVVLGHPANEAEQTTVLGHVVASEHTPQAAAATVANNANEAATTTANNDIQQLCTILKKLKSNENTRLQSAIGAFEHMSRRSALNLNAEEIFLNNNYVKNAIEEYKTKYRSPRIHNFKLWCSQERTPDFFPYNGFENTALTLTMLIGLHGLISLIVGHDNNSPQCNATNVTNVTNNKVTTKSELIDNTFMLCLIGIIGILYLSSFAATAIEKTRTTATARAEHLDNAVLAQQAIALYEKHKPAAALTVSAQP